jgi:hypothetical protein
LEEKLTFRRRTGSINASPEDSARLLGLMEENGNGGNPGNLSVEPFRETEFLFRYRLDCQGVIEAAVAAA